MSKTYDHLEWNFFEAVMRKVGFCEDLTKLTMKCIFIVTYKIKINRKTRGPNVPYNVLSKLTS